VVCIVHPFSRSVRSPLETRADKIIEQRPDSTVSIAHDQSPAVTRAPLSVESTSAALSQVPVVRQFGEHLSTADEVNAEWTPGKPVFKSRVEHADSDENFITYYLRDRSIVEENWSANRYRVFEMDTLGIPQQTDPLESIDQIGTYRIKSAR